MSNVFAVLLLAVVTVPAFSQDATSWLATLPQPKEYVQKRASSYDRSGGNADYRTIAPGETLTLLDDGGPGLITHMWFTIASDDPHHLKALVLRMYWDGEASPSVEAPVGDFFGLGLGDYHVYQSAPLSVGSDKALNCFFPMPFAKHARITVTNEGSIKTDAFYFNIDYRAYSKAPAGDQLYFHAQYRQAAPAQGWTNQWHSNGDPNVNDKKNLNGEGNFVWMEATGRGHFVGVTMSVLQNQEGWWGEGDDMFFVDGETKPSINGTGSEDYFLGAWDFGGHPFSYELNGAPVVGEEVAGGRSSLYRFHLDSPIPFTKSLRATIEHGHANHRSDNYYSVAYWYQSEPHAPFPTLPGLEQRIPRIYPVGGPGNAGK
ncbi:MAG TPA: glycoside hydrolase family 172 protein [Candidatus Sulfotelmatobacter sp.]|nr:glycoside hydrolase family 172 protein [Candidatus Sulfotelmatobacter sp.]